MLTNSNIHFVSCYKLTIGGDMKRQLFILFFILSFSTFIYAQWSNDPAINNAICDLNGEQAIPKVVTSVTGDTYIGYFSNDSGNYDVRLQRLDSQGNELWDHNGILVSDNPAMTWLTDWDMTVDDDNNAILVFQDIRNGGNNNVYVYKIAPDGTFVWGSDGLELSNSSAFSAAPKVIVTSSGNAVVAWSEDAVSMMQKIAADGTLLWGANGIDISGTNTISWPQPIAINNDEIILKHFEDSGSFPGITRHCFAQRYDVDGNPVWTAPTVVSNAGGISAWTQVFNIISDENNGCFITWHDSRSGGTISYPFVQHINSDGSVGFAANGVQLSTETNRQNFYPEAVYDAANDELITYWSQTDGNQNNHGISGQKIDAGGNLIWGANGNNIIPVSNLYILPFAVRAAAGDLIILFEEYTNAVDAYVKAMKLDTDGNYVWTEQQVTMCSIAASKVHSVAGQLVNDKIIATWEDDRNGASDIFAQNINLDGSLGVSFTPVWLTDFNTSYIDENVTLNWTTAWETNNSGWNIYRSQTAIFEEAIQVNIDLIPGMGTVTIPTDYVFIDDDDFTVGEVYWYWLEAVDMGGATFLFGPVIIIIEGVDTNEILNNYNNLSNYPNPFNPITNVSYSINETSKVTIEVYNLKGQLVKTLVNEVKDKGDHSVTWNGSDSSNKSVSSGIYLYKMKSNNFTSIKKMILMK